MRAHPICRSEPPGRDPLLAARAGEHPSLIAKLRSGYVTMGETQFLPGYCVLLVDSGPRVEHLTDLPRPERTRFLCDLGLIGEALTAACPVWDPAFTRLDYEILGNRWRRLAAHVFPRYAWEPVELRGGSVWAYPPERWTDPAYALGPAHERLLESIARELSRVLAEAY